MENSEFNDDSNKTESELNSEDEEERKRVAILEKNSIVGVELYRKYLMWAVKYKTTTVAREEKDYDYVI